MDKSLALIKHSLINKLTKWDDFVVFGQQVRVMKDVSQWWTGDLARRVTTKYGEDSLGKYARETGNNYKSLLEYRRVAKAYPRKTDRLPFLSWTHHQRALKSANPYALLIKAHDNEWSIRQMERYMIEKKAKSCSHSWKKFLICELCGKKKEI